MNNVKTLLELEDEIGLKLMQISSALTTTAQALRYNTYYNNESAHTLELLSEELEKANKIISDFVENSKNEQ